MDEINKVKEKNDSILYFLVGLTLGALVVYMFVKDRQPYAKLTDISILNNRLNNIEQTLTPNKLDIPSNYIVPRFVEKQQIQENDENWTFIKSDDGKITGVNVKRKLYNTNK